jgi:hypothetical protein
MDHRQSGIVILLLFVIASRKMAASINVSRHTENPIAGLSRNALFNAT